MRGQRFIRDRFTNVNFKNVSTACLQVIDALQTLAPDEQVAACTSVFALCCERFGIEKREALEVINNLLNDTDKDSAELRAVKMYMTHEW